jgi:hypothetical protein
MNRRLAKGSNRAMALAGVARVFGREYELTHVTGLFMEYMPHTLVSHAKRPVSQEGALLENQIAFSSWAWFSCSRHLMENFTTEACWDERKENEKVLEARSRVFQATVSSHWSGTATYTTSDTSFHDLTGLSLVLKAPISTVVTFNRQRKEGFKL